jgi:hypothetical protein
MPATRRCYLTFLSMYSPQLQHACYLLSVCFKSNPNPMLSKGEQDAIQDERPDAVQDEGQDLDQKGTSVISLWH